MECPTGAGSQERSGTPIKLKIRVLIRESWCPNLDGPTQAGELARAELSPLSYPLPDSRKAAGESGSCGLSCCRPINSMAMAGRRAGLPADFSTAAIGSALPNRRNTVQALLLRGMSHAVSGAKRFVRGRTHPCWML
jgi:hypothetical protein